MGPSAAGAVVLVAFPFSDLSRSKLRPALALANAGNGDWVMCQITSRPFADPAAIMIDAADFAAGSLRLVSYVRPAKLFTAHASLIVSEVGVLKEGARVNVVDTVTRILRQGQV